MVTEGFLWVVNRVPSVRLHLWRAVFEVIATYFRHADFWTFMNYGYAPADAEPVPPLPAADWDDRYPIYLYHRVAASADLRGGRVLDVGCGRGGGSAYILRALGPRQVVGLDLAGSAVAFCRRTHKAPGLSFERGDSCNMPFPDASFDAVVNVESSFCYPSIERFFAEVKRVLRPGGHFLYADLRFKDEIDGLDQSLAESGLTLVSRDDITRNVADALLLDSPRRKAGGIKAPPLLRKPFDLFLGVEGTRIPTLLGNGGMVYVVYRLDKAIHRRPNGSSAENFA